MVKSNNGKFVSRDKFQMIREVLESLPGRQTRIMHKAHLGHYQACYLFHLLQEAKLMDGRNSSGIFSITEKGKRYLHCMNNRGLEFELDSDW